MAAKTYHWPGEKKSRQHTISIAQHQKNVTPRQKLKAALTPEQRKAKRLAKPVVPGGALTRGQLNKQTRAAARVEFGPLEAQQQRNVGEAKAWQRDIGGYYDDYLAQISKQAERVAQHGATAQQAIQGLQGGVTGLATADLKGIQAPANADAAARGATAGDQSQMASNAAAVRQALVGSFGAQQAARSDAASRYADTLAHNVGPGQKLQAVAMAQGRIRQGLEDQGTTAAKKGAFKTQYRGEARTGEEKNVLARQVAQVESADKAFDRRITRKKTNADIRNDKAAQKLAWAKLDADTAADAAKAAAAGEKINKYGIPESTWQGMGTPARQKVIRNFGSGGGKGGGGGGKSALSTPGQRGDAMTQITELTRFAKLAKQGKPFDPAHANKKWVAKPLSRPEAAEKLKRSFPKVKNPVLWSAALDAIYDGHLSRDTQRRLRAAGYSRREAAEAASTLTRGAYDKDVRSYGGPH